MFTCHFTNVLFPEPTDCPLSESQVAHRTLTGNLLDSVPLWQPQSESTCSKFPPGFSFPTAEILTHLTASPLELFPLFVLKKIYMDFCTSQSHLWRWLVLTVNCNSLSYNRWASMIHKGMGKMAVTNLWKSKHYFVPYFWWENGQSLQKASELIRQMQP